MNIQTQKSSVFEQPSPALQQILQRKDLWKGDAPQLLAQESVSSGYAQLDQQLLHKGWPTQGLLEVQSAQAHAGWHLFLPAIQQLMQQPGYLFLVAPPAIPYAPGLVQQGVDTRRLFVAEPQDKNEWLAAVLEIMNAGCSLMLLFWEPKQRLLYPEMRKLQLAASKSGSLCVMFRAPGRNIAASPAQLRVSLNALQDGLSVQIEKQRGSHNRGSVVLPWPSFLRPDDSMLPGRLETDQPVPNRAQVLPFPA